MRPRITRCWIGAGNSFTVVRLLDGKILRTFRNDPAGLAPDHPVEVDAPASAFIDNGATNVVGTYSGIDAPITGAVSIYPGAVGTVTTRAFVGDEDGDLWKADLSDTNPDNWSFKLFHDAYSSVVFAPTDAPPQPVATAPVITVDRLGNVVTIYATGDQSNFSSVNHNHMFSVSETIVPGPPAKAVASINWHLPFTGGVTPTGPISLFSGDLFFSTFTPGVSTDSACLTGQGTLWGVDFVETEPGTGTPGLPRARFTQVAGDVVSATCPIGFANADARLGFSKFFRCLQLDPGSIVFGAGVTQRPSCVDTSSTIGTDPYTGATSSHQTITGISQGDFQLVAQTGPKAPSSGSGGTTTHTFTRTLTAPVSITTLASWATIVE